MRRALIIIEAPGKVRAWERAARKIGIASTLLTTRGHMSRFPDKLSPFGVRFESGRAVDEGRVPSPTILRRMENALLDLPLSAEILIATDDDPEGDVIALDVFRSLIGIDRSLVGRIRRVRARSVTVAGITDAIARATQDPGLSDLFLRAVPGRARAISDRWIGSAFTELAGTGCGRVRAAILGAALLWRRDPTLLRGVPETGELTFTVRSDPTGLPFFARIPIQGAVSAPLKAIAERYRGRMIPGHVRPMASLSAAVAPRIGDVSPFNTGDALAYAGRFHGVPPQAAMRGLQNAYMAGRISYPRTSGRHLTEQACGLVVQAARACGVVGVTDQDAQRHLPNRSEISAHEALYPTPELLQADLHRLKTTVRRAAPPLGIGAAPRSDEEIEDLMVGLVARRAFDAARPIELMPGVWHNRDGSDLTAEEVDALDELEWLRPSGPSAPWSNNMSTSFRVWPLSSVLIDGMMAEEVGRPSTYALHAEAISGSGQLRTPFPGGLPELTAEGTRVLKRIPKEALLPETCRAIERALSSASDREAGVMDMTRLIRMRIDGWMAAAPDSFRSPLIEHLLRVAQADLSDPQTERTDLFGTEALLPDPEPIDLPSPDDAPAEDPLGDPETQIADLIF
jgi:DNA topoisomerase-1